jgi:hypothetical protein
MVGFQDAATGLRPSLRMYAFGRSGRRYVPAREYGYKSCADQPTQKVRDCNIAEDPISFGWEDSEVHYTEGYLGEGYANWEDRPRDEACLEMS